MNLINKLIQLEQEAAEFGFKWESAEQIMQQIQSEFAEVNEHLQSQRLSNSVVPFVNRSTSLLSLPAGVRLMD